MSKGWRNFIFKMSSPKSFKSVPSTFQGFFFWMIDSCKPLEVKRLHIRGWKTPPLICHKTEFFAWESLCRTSGVPVYGVSVRPSEIWFHSSRQSQASAADSRFYLMWMSCVGFQRRLQHMISIMTRGGTHAGGRPVTQCRQERVGRCKRRWRKANRWGVVRREVEM